MKRGPLLILMLLVLAVGGRYIYGIANPPDDKALIKQALADAVKASKEGRPGSVVDKLTENFKINDMQPGIRQVAEYVKTNHPDVVIADTDPIVSGDTAQITSDVSVKVSLLGADRSFTFKDTVMQFKKESAMDWIIFPATRWRLSAARVPAEDISGILGP